MMSRHDDERSGWGTADLRPCLCLATWSNLVGSNVVYFGLVGLVLYRFSWS